MSAIAPASDFAKIGRQQYGILFRIADLSKSGKVTLEDFVSFERLLKKPDAEFDVSPGMMRGRRSFADPRASHDCARADWVYAPLPDCLQVL